MNGCAMCLNSGVTRIDGCLAPCVCELGAFQRKRNSFQAITAYRKSNKEPHVPNPSTSNDWHQLEAMVGDLPKCKPLYLCGHGCGAVVRTEHSSCSRCYEEFWSLQAGQAKANDALIAKPLPPFLIYAIGYACGVLSVLLYVLMKVNL